MNKTILLLMTILIFSTCKKLDGCANNIACTEEFRSIYIEVTSSTYHPLLDSYNTTRIRDGKLIENNNGLVFESPIVFDDSNISETTFEGEKFLFEGYQDGVKVISEDYVIKHDCCHIIKVTGKDSINL